MSETRPSKTFKGYGDPQVSSAAFYFTVVFNDAGEVEALFFNSKEMESFQWITALMVSYGRRLKDAPCEQYDETLAEVIQDMCDAFNPHGKYHAGPLGEVNSVVHHLGLLLKKATS